MINSDEGAFALPAPSPDEAEALRRAVAVLEAVEPASRQQIENMIGKLAIALPTAGMSRSEAVERVDLYWKALRDIPLDALHYAFSALIRTARFFPTVREIRDAASYPMSLRAWRLSRMKVLLRRHEREWQEPQPVEEAPTADVEELLKEAGRKAA